MGKKDKNIQEHTSIGDKRYKHCSTCQFKQQKLMAQTLISHLEHLPSLTTAVCDRGTAFSMAEPMVTRIYQPMRPVESHVDINECNGVCSASWPPVFVFVLIGNTWRYLNPLFTLQHATWVANDWKQHLVAQQKQPCVWACFLPLLCYFTPARSIQ